jgi:hypothetical protein
MFEQSRGLHIPSTPIDTCLWDHASSAEQEEILRAELAAAGVQLGAYDERIVRWLAGWDWPTVVVVTSLIRRAAQRR